MDKYNEQRGGLAQYIIYAIGLAFVVYFFLNIGFRIIVIVSKFVFKYVVEYWYIAIILFFVVVWFKRKGKRK